MTASQIPLFATTQTQHGVRIEPAPPYVRGSETSKAAAEAIRPHVGTQQAGILAWFEYRGAIGMTDYEGACLSGIDPSAYRPRRGELVKKGYIEDSGMTRPTASGRQATVWSLKA